MIFQVFFYLLIPPGQILAFPVSRYHLVKTSFVELMDATDIKLNIKYPKRFHIGVIWSSPVVPKLGFCPPWVARHHSRGARNIRLYDKNVIYLFFYCVFFAFFHSSLFDFCYTIINVSTFLVA